MAESAREATATYDEDGYAVVRDVVDGGLVEEARRHVDWLREQNPDRRPEDLDHDLVAGSPFWVRLVSDERLLDVAEAVLGEDLALFASHYVAKPPEEGQRVLWHQDGAYWPLDPIEDVVTVWLSLDEVTPENGCMRVVPGTQDLDLLEVEERTDVENVLDSGLADHPFEEAEAVDLELSPGDVSVHHPNVVHGSEANTSDRWRRGLTVRYIPTTTYVEAEPWDSAFHLRGDPGDRNTYQPYPLYDPDDDAQMPFDGWEAYNERARERNAALRAAGSLAGDG
ncbi:MAG: phytanoyl-CoA dioxygenase family protein [Halobacteriaceae archaeon]